MTTLSYRSAHRFKLNDCQWGLLYVLCFSMFSFPHKFSRPQVYLFERRLYIFVALRAQVYILRPANFRWRRSNWCTTGSQGWRWGEEIGKVARNEIEFVVNWIFWMLQMKWNVLFISTLSIIIEGFQMRLWIWKRDCCSQQKFFNMTEVFFLLPAYDSRKVEENLNSNVPPCLWKPLWLQGLVLKSLNSLNPWQKLFSSLVKVFPNNNCEKENPARVHFHCLMILFLLAENSRLLDLLFPLFLNQDHLFHFPKNLIYKEIILLQQY